VDWIELFQDSFQCRDVSINFLGSVKCVAFLDTSLWA